MKYIPLFIVIIFSFIIGCAPRVNLPNERLSSQESKSKSDDIPKGWPWHGIVVSTHYDMDVEVDINKLHQLGANFITIYLKPEKLAEFENIDFDLAFNYSLQKADSILDKCKSLNMYAMIYYSDFQTENKEKNKNGEFWGDENAMNSANTNITKIIDHFKNRGDELQAYQFIGEPILQKEGKQIQPPEWNAFFKKIYEYKKLNDINRYILYAPGPGGGPGSYSSATPIVDDPKVIYTFHYYLPFSFTHQGINGHDESTTYPSMIGFSYWDKPAIEQSITGVINFSEKYNKLIYVGEFSAVYEAKGWEQYLSDAMDVFIQHRFAYTYFGWNSWSGWAVSDKNQTSISKRKIGDFNSEERTKRLELISTYWKKNSLK